MLTYAESAQHGKQMLMDIQEARTRDAHWSTST
jgi:hypothetical protein